MKITFKRRRLIAKMTLIGIVVVSGSVYVLRQIVLGHYDYLLTLEMQLTVAMAIPIITYFTGLGIFLINLKNRKDYGKKEPKHSTRSQRPANAGRNGEGKGAYG